MYYRLGNKAYLGIWSAGDDMNYHFSIYNYDNYKMESGGFTDFDKNHKLASASRDKVVAEIAKDFNVGSYSISVVDSDNIVKAIRNANSSAPSKKSNSDEISPPCPHLPAEWLVDYGYTCGEMWPLELFTAIDLFDNYCSVYLLYEDDTEAEATTEMEIFAHYASGGCIGVEKKTWERIAYRYESADTLRRKELEFLQNGTNDGFAIYQLKSIEENDNIVFMNSQWLEEHNIPIDKTRYTFRYCDDLTKVIEMFPVCTTNDTDEIYLDNIYEIINFHKPEDYHARSVSVSDVILLRRGGISKWYYVDSIGFKEVNWG